MYNTKNIAEMNVESYLESKGVHICNQRGNELICRCPFSGCDDDSRGNEGHFYFNVEKGAYYCHKCGAKGNKVTLAQHFGDWERLSWTESKISQDIQQPPILGTESSLAHTEPALQSQDKGQKKKRAYSPRSNEAFAKKCHEQLSSNIREYLKSRGLKDAIIDDAMIGEGLIYGSDHRIMIPIMDTDGNVVFFKARCLPGKEGETEKYKYFNVDKNASSTAMLYNGYLLEKKKTETAMITEGEFDALVANQNKLPLTVSSTSGAATFKEEWVQHFKYVRTLYVALDNDEKGREGARKMIELFSQKMPNTTIMQVTYPGTIKDMTDYFLAGHSSDDLLKRYSTHVGGPKPIDVTGLPEMSIDELASVLNTTIKYDYANKCITFLAMLTAYTESDQLNIFITGPASSGKTYLMQEVAAYFPEEDKELIAQASPTAFKHRQPVIDPDTGKKYVDLERKLVLFQDVPGFQLQETLRPLMSHDKKEIVYLTTDRGKSSDLLTKESTIRGFAVFITCSANSRMDEQESTRAIVLSPEVSKDKIKAGVKMASIKNSNPEEFAKLLASNADRRNLMERVRYIKNLHINSVIVPSEDEVRKEFDAIAGGNSMPRHQRDIAHFYSLIKAIAMLNAHLRLDENQNVIANSNDVKAAVQLWSTIYKAVELGVAPYIRDFYYNYIIPAYNERDVATYERGVPRANIKKKYYELTGDHINDDKLRKDILPALKEASIIEEVKADDKKTLLVTPLYDVNSIDADNLETDVSEDELSEEELSYIDKQDQYTDEEVQKRRTENMLKHLEM